MSPLECLLKSYRTASISERDKGAAFEKLVAAWLVTDPVQAKRFARVELWSDWARHQNLDRTDTGIDLVGTLHDGGFAAIQCKFFDAARRIRKEDIDTFISASAKSAFAERPDCRDYRHIVEPKCRDDAARPGNPDGSYRPARPARQSSGLVRLHGRRALQKQTTKSIKTKSADSRYE